MEWHKRGCRCFSCNHTWDGMIADDTQDGLECPNCHHKRGEVVQTRLFHFRREFVSCLVCVKNYGADMKPGFCQEFSKKIDPNDLGLNQNTAATCRYWHPNEMPRGMVRADAEEHIRWYEKE